MIAAALVASAVIVGGGGTPAPMAELALQLLTVLAVLAWVFLAPRNGRRVSRAIFALAILVVLIPILQLVPLPPDIWRALPGREAPAAALDLVGEGSRWMPVTLVKPATLASLLSLATPLAAMVMVGALPARSRSTVLAAIALCGAATVLIGLGQFAGTGDTLRLYEKTNDHWLTGFQASRTLAVDVLLIGMLAFAAICATGALGRYSRYWLGIGMAVAALAVALTGSRVGVALLVPACLLAILIAMPATRLNARRVAGYGGAAVVAAAAGASAMMQVPTLSRVLARFGGEGDGRHAIWRDSWDAALAYWPVGGGTGAFPYLFLPYEALEAVDQTHPNRAHNEILEIMIESGAPGLLALAIGLGIVGWLVVSAFRRDAVPREQRLFSVGCIGIIALHSLVDYPLRSMSTASLFAVAIALLALPRAGRDATKANVA